MTRITVKVGPGAKLVRQGLQNLAKETPLVGRSQIYKAMVRAKTRLREYPPEPAESTYIRTERLKESVEIEKLDTGYKISVDPVSQKGIHYGKYPLGNAFGLLQAWMHKGRWPLFRDIVDEEIAQLPGDIQAELQVVARRNGLK